MFGCIFSSAQCVYPPHMCVGVIKHITVCYLSFCLLTWLRVRESRKVVYKYWAWIRQQFSQLCQDADQTYSENSFAVDIHWYVCDHFSEIKVEYLEVGILLSHTVSVWSEQIYNHQWMVELVLNWSSKSVIFCIQLMATISWLFCLTFKKQHLF